MNSPKDSKLKYYDVSNSDSSNKNKTKAFLMAGEHPRELISVETMIGFLEELMNNNKKNEQILNDYDLRIVINANPEAREKVEKGEYCRRVNLNNVDINRNWDYNWGKKIELSEENPGKKPFSEIETRFIKYLVEDFKPKLFLALHSGIYGLYMPYAFEKKEATEGNDMKKILKQIKNQFCKVCQVGAPSLNIGYISSGTGLDYVYTKLKVPYTYVFEVYTNEIKNPDLIEYKRKMEKKNLKRINFKEKEDDINFIQTTTKVHLDRKFLKKKVLSKDDNNECIELFNPLDKHSYNYIISNWTKVLKFLINSVKKAK